MGRSELRKKEKRVFFTIATPAATPAVNFELQLHVVTPAVPFFLCFCQTAKILISDEC
jgi:hypothetical protein